MTQRSYASTSGAPAGHFDLMKPAITFALGALLLLAGQSISIAETAVARVDKVNVRAQPSKQGEILGSLRKGEPVVVMDKLPAAGAGESQPWTKIALPERVAVWVHVGSIDAKAGTVRAKKAILRAGPGVNYSELGEADQGAPVTLVRQMDDWAQIGAPAGTYAFVASNLLEPAAAAVAPKPDATLNMAKPALDLRHPAVATQETAIPLEPDPRATIESRPLPPVTGRVTTSARSKPLKVTIDPAPPRQVATPPDEAIEQPPTRSAGTNIITTTTTVVTTPGVYPEVTAPSQPIIYKDQVRQVYRHGVVGRSLNPKTPTLFELRSLRSGEGLLDYIYSEDPAVKLGPFEGRRVVVTGEEYVDPKYDQAPVIKLKEIRND